MTFNTKEHERNLEIIRLRNVEKLTLKKIGGFYKISRERVRQICKFGSNLQEYKIYLKTAKLKRHYPPKLKRIRNIYACLRQRVVNPKHKDYKHYGGRGITMTWKNFDEFYLDMKKGYRDNLTIDRIDNNKGYSKNNCRWIPFELQLKNRRPHNEWNLESDYWKKNKGKKQTFEDLKPFIK